MKARILFMLFALIFVSICSAQIPQMFNYQAVVRNAENGLIANQEVGFKMSILEGSADGSPVYVETHAVTTNGVGLADLVIGDGSVVNGTFTGIPWGDNTFFLKVEVDPAGGSSYGHIGTSQLTSVPYALYSGNISSPTRKFTIQENQGHPADSALFEVRNLDGQTVFAVYPEGTRVYVLDEEGKGKKGGFAVGGYSRTAKGITQEYMRISPDSIRLYVDKSATKGKKGGFAVGGYSRSVKGPVDHYFELVPDSAVFTLVSETGDISGNALSVQTKRAGASPDEPAQASLFNLTWDNYFIGHRAGEAFESGSGNAYFGLMAGKSTKTGDNNSFIGFRAGDNFASGGENVMIGFSAGADSKTGNSNVFIGSDAGANSSGDQNVFLGAGSGGSVKNGSRNVMIGSGAGLFADSSQNNVFIGAMSGYHHVGGPENVFLGNNSGWSHQNGGNNIFIGGGSGYFHVDGSNNVFIGQRAGFNNTNGENNIFIGYEAGMDVVSDGKLIIDLFNRPPEQAFIVGDMYNNNLRINNQVGVGRNADAHALEVEGSVSKSEAGDWVVNSDARIKTDIEDITGAREQIMRIRPVKFRYTGEWMEKHPSIRDTEHYNFVAQEFQQVFPDAVKAGSDKLAEGDPLLQMDSYPAQIVAIKAIQELIEENRSQQEAIDRLLDKVDALEQQLSAR